MMKKIAITQSNYIPWKGYFDMINRVDTFVIYDDVQYTKRDWRNRNRIITRDGLLWLTIPVQVKNKFGQKINETLVFGSHWRMKHWKTIQANYSRAKWFNRYHDRFEKLYTGEMSDNLSEINQVFLNEICDILGIRTEFIRSSELDLQGDKTGRLVSACQKLGADVYLSGPAARAYLDENRFHKHNIEVEWMEYEGYPEYHQLFPPFEHSVSIIDLIFNEGPDAGRFMKSFHTQEHQMK